MMRAELEEILYQRYPDFFVDRTMPPEASCMGRGFECGDGWFELIDCLCETLQWWIQHCEMPPLRVTQVKEKFGTLRFRYCGGNEVTKGMVRMAEAISARNPYTKQ